MTQHNIGPHEINATRVLTTSPPFAARAFSACARGISSSCTSLFRDISCYYLDDTADLAHYNIHVFTLD